MLKIGEYTRINGKIGKVKDIVLNSNNYEDSGIYLENEKFVLGKEEIYKLKSSYNIIDLIEVGDYVNGLLLTRIYFGEEANKKYQELKQKAQPFLDALEVASEKVWAFINSILAIGNETQEHKAPARKRGQDMEI